MSLPNAQFPLSPCHDRPFSCRYYRLFVYHSALALRRASFLMVNSSWTTYHVDTILAHPDICASISYTYPPLSPVAWCFPLLAYSRSYLHQKDISLSPSEPLRDNGAHGSFTSGQDHPGLGSSQIIPLHICQSRLRVRYHLLCPYISDRQLEAAGPGPCRDKVIGHVLDRWTHVIEYYIRVVAYKQCP